MSTVYRNDDNIIISLATGLVQSLDTSNKRDTNTQSVSLPCLPKCHDQTCVTIPSTLLQKVAHVSQLMKLLQQKVLKTACVFNNLITLTVDL